MKNRDIQSKINNRLILAELIMLTSHSRANSVPANKIILQPKEIIITPNKNKERNKDKV